MTNPARGIALARRALAGVALVFGAVTLFAGGRVLMGADPGYVVFRPLLLFNTAMGGAYLAAGVLVLRQLARGLYAAGAIFVVNLLVLAALTWRYSSGGAVAIDSLRAMTLRTGVWLALFAALAWLHVRSLAVSPPPPR